MADKQTREDKDLAMREYRLEQQHTVALTEKLRAERLAREAEQPAAAEDPEPAVKKKKR